MAWRGLQHPNVLGLLGITIVGYRFVMVSEWMKNGHVRRYLETNPEVNRLQLVRPVLVLYNWFGTDRRRSETPQGDLYICTVKE